jgi:hypothetical protein
VQLLFSILFEGRSAAGETGFSVLLLPNILVSHPHCPESCALQLLIRNTDHRCMLLPLLFRMGGLDTLLRLLTSGPDAAMLRQLLEALKQLLQEEAGQQAFVAGGGVPQMMHCLTHTSLEVVEGAAVVLARTKDLPLAQQAMRWGSTGGEERGEHVLVGGTVVGTGWEG